MRESFIFQFLAGAGVSIQIFVLGPCEIVKIFVTPARISFKLCVYSLGLMRVWTP